MQFVAQKTHRLPLTSRCVLYHGGRSVKGHSPVERRYGYLVGIVSKTQAVRKGNARNNGEYDVMGNKRDVQGYPSRSVIDSFHTREPGLQASSSEERAPLNRPTHILPHRKGYDVKTGSVGCESRRCRSESLPFPIKSMMKMRDHDGSMFHISLLLSGAKDAR